MGGSGMFGARDLVHRLPHDFEKPDPAFTTATKADVQRLEQRIEELTREVAELRAMQPPTLALVHGVWRVVGGPPPAEPVDEQGWWSAFDRQLGAAVSWYGSRNVDPFEGLRRGPPNPGVTVQWWFGRWDDDGSSNPIDDIRKVWGKVAGGGR